MIRPRTLWFGAGVLLLFGVLMFATDHVRAQTSDNTPPTLTSAKTDTTGEHVILTFSEDIRLNPLVVMATQYFDELPRDFFRAIIDVYIDDRLDYTTSAEHTGNQVVFRVTSPTITSTQTVTVAYNNIFAKTYGSLITDLAGNALAFFEATAVENLSTDTSTISLASAPVLSPQSLTITEGGTGKYTVALASAPTKAVKVHTSLSVTEGTTVEPRTLSFDQDNWSVPQEVTVGAPDNAHAFHRWAGIVHSVGRFGASPSRSTSIILIVFENSDAALAVTGNAAVAHAENTTTALGTYAVAGSSSITWGVYGEDRDLFAISSAGELSIVSAPDFEDPKDSNEDNVYVIAILASSESSTGFLPVAVSVTNVAEPPEFPGTSTTREVPENVATGTNVGAPVAANDSPTYTLEGADADSFDIVSSTGQIRTKAGVTYNHEAKSRYYVTVKADDGNGGTDTIAVTITITNANDPPVFPDATAAREVAENVRPGANVGAPISASDEDKDALTYTLDGADAGSFTIDSRRGQIRTRPGVTYDHEATPSYSVTVNVSDGKDASGETDAAVDDSIDVSITVTDVNEAPMLTGPVRASFPENDTGVVASYTAVDPDSGDSITWSLQGTDNSLFTIDGNGEVGFLTPPDREARNPVYRLTVRASDGALHSTRNLVVTVTNVNEAPTVTGPDAETYPENGTRNVARYQAADPERDALIWSLGGSNADDFAIAGGVLAFKAPPDYEAPGGSTYQVTVRVSDGSLDGERDVTVTVTNVDEPGALELSSSQPLVGTQLTATLTDLDGSLSDETWTWERSTNRSSWATIDSASSASYTPADADLDHYLRASVDYTDGHGPDKRRQAASSGKTQAPPPDNHAPEFPSGAEDRSVPENSPARTTLGTPVRANDADNDALVYELSGSDLFTIDRDNGQIRVDTGAVLDHEQAATHTVTVTATDPSNASDSTSVTIAVSDVNEPPTAVDDRATTSEDMPTAPIDVAANDEDPDELDVLTASIQQQPRNGSVTLGSGGTVTCTPRANYHGSDSFTYRLTDGQYTATGTVIVNVQPVNDPPAFAAASISRTISSSVQAGANIGAPVTASDVDGDSLSYALSGGGGAFVIDEFTGQVTVEGSTPLDPANPYSLTVSADDGNGGVASIRMIVTVTAAPPPPIIGPVIVGPFFGGGPSGPEPSDEDFEWTVTHDLDALDPGHGSPTGMWSDGTTLWLADNAEGAGDAVYAYGLASGERVEEREFALDEQNRAPRGVWSDGATVWVSDSGRDQLFAYDLESGERLAGRDLELTSRNRDARGVWGRGEVLWVLDGGKDALFAYDLDGALLAEYELADANSDPRGIWSDGVTVWVSDHAAKRLYAYRLPEPPEAPAAEDAEPVPLERSTALDFTELSKASNLSPRGIWSDGAVMYVADANDGKVYTYNMPGAIDPRLASLTIEGVDVGEFDPDQTRYEGVADEGVTATTVAAEAQPGATVAVEPADADEEAEGHQVDLAGVEEVTVTVTSEDGSRTRTYRVRLAEAGPSASCLRGNIDVGFSLVVFEGGTVDDLAGCAEGRAVTALYALHEGEYVSYILGAPELVNAPFRALFTDAVPALTPLIASSVGPPSPDPSADSALSLDWPECLRGEVAAGFSLVVFAGGTAEELRACAESRNVTAVYALAGGEWVSYILGAPEFVNARFGELFAEGVPVATPLVVRSDVAQSTGVAGDEPVEN